HGSCDVLDLLLAEIVKGDVEAVAHPIQRRGTAANPAPLGPSVKPGCNVDAVAEDFALPDDDGPALYAHAKFGARLCRCRGVWGDHLPLQLDRTAHRVDDAGELDKEAVAGRFDDATPMLGDLGIAEFTANRTQRRERALLILAHQPRIAGNIDRQNGRRPSLDPFSLPGIHGPMPPQSLHWQHGPTVAEWVLSSSGVGIIVLTSIQESLMPLNIRSEAVNQLAERLATRTRMSKTDAVRTALENELHRLDGAVPLRERLRPLQDRGLRRPATGLEPGKAFYDELSGNR